MVPLFSLVMNPEPEDLGSFNCQPAMNSQAVIRPLANTGDVPYVAMDCECPWISTNQRRLLETVAVQAKRIRKMKSGMPPPESINIRQS